MDVFTDLKVIHLDDVDKYNEWSREVKAELLDRRQLWDIVKGTDELPKPEKNDRALEVIRRECRNEFCYAIEKISSAKIAWDTLAAICALHSYTKVSYIGISTSLSKMHMFKHF